MLAAGSSEPGTRRVATRITLTIDLVVAHTGPIDREHLLDAVLGEGSQHVDVLEISEAACSTGVSREVRYA